MREEMKRKYAAIFIVITLSLSILSYASEQREIPIYLRRPLTQEEISEIVKRDHVVVEYIWNYDCETCLEYEDMLRDMAYKFNGSVTVVALDTFNYPNIPILDLPYLRVIGKKNVEEFKIDIPNETEVREIICNAFEKPPTQCS
jgi:thiol-disulfide isomerase/thioredoxin